MNASHSLCLQPWSDRSVLMLTDGFILSRCQREFWFFGPRSFNFAPCVGPRHNQNTLWLVMENTGHDWLCWPTTVPAVHTWHLCLNDKWTKTHSDTPWLCNRRLVELIGCVHLSAVVTPPEESPPESPVPPQSQHNSSDWRASPPPHWTMWLCWVS